MKKEKTVDLSLLSNLQLCEKIKDLPPGREGRVDDWYNSHYVYLGNTCSGDPSEAVSENHKEVWDILRSRIDEFLKKKTEIHRKYYGTPYFPYNDDTTAKLIGAVASKSKNSNSILVYAVMSVEDRDMWVTTERISFKEFGDTNFVENYSKQLRKRRLMLIDSGIEKCLIRMGKLLEEQEKLKKEEGD